MYLGLHRLAEALRVLCFAAAFLAACGTPRAGDSDGGVDADVVPKGTIGRDNDYVILARHSAVLGNRATVHSGIVGVSDGLETYPPSGAPCISGMSRNGCYAGDAEQALVLDEVNFASPSTTSRFVGDTVRVLGASRLPKLFHGVELVSNPGAFVTETYPVTADYFPVFPALPETPASLATGDSSNLSPYVVYGYQCFGPGTWNVTVHLADGATLELRDDCVNTDGVSDFIEVRDIRTARLSVVDIESAHEVRVRDLVTGWYGATISVDAPTFHARNVIVESGNSVSFGAGTYHARNLWSEGTFSAGGTAYTPTHVILKNRLYLDGPTYANEARGVRYFVHGHDGPDAMDLPGLDSSMGFPPRPYAASIGSMDGNVMALPGNGASGGTIEIRGGANVTGAFFADHVIVGPSAQITRANGLSGPDGPFPEYLEDDEDNDGIDDETDNCPDHENPEQEDADGDALGNACDNCPDVANPRQETSATPGVGAACSAPPGAYCGNGLVESGEACDDGFANHGTHLPCNRQCGLSAPRFTYPPENVNVALGDPVFSPIMAVGASPMTYEWKHDGVTIMGATLPYLYIASTQPSDVGTYTCIVRNAHGEAMASAWVHIPPIIHTQPSSLSLHPGDTATFTVSAASGTGASVPTYQWRRDGVAIPGATSASYTIPVVNTTHSGGVYTVLVTEPTGFVESTPATLIVTYAAGDGTPVDPFLIDGCAALQGLGAFPFAHFALTQDVDCDGFEATGDGTGFAPIGTTAVPFGGNLDGRGHVIRNLRVARTSGDANNGLLGVAQGAHVRNVGMEGASIVGGSYTGILVGFGSQVELDGVYVKGSVSGTTYVGALGGSLQNALVRDSYSAASVTTTTGATSGLLVGDASAAVITRVYAASTLTGATPYDLFGVESGSSLSSTLMDCTLTGQSPCTGGKRTTAALQSPATFLEENPSWDLGARWGFRRGSNGHVSGYPCLRFEQGCGTDPFCGDGARAEWPITARELCDDGNAVEDDGCSSTCVPTPIIIDAATALQFRAAALTSHASAAVDGFGVVLFVDTRDYFSSGAVYARRANAASAFIDAEPFRIDSGLPTAASASPAVIGLPSGGFVVAWSARRAGTMDIVARMVRTDGSLGNEVLVNTERTGTQEKPALAITDDSIVIAWTSRFSSEEDPLGGVRARRFDARLSPRGPEIMLAASREAFEQDVSVAAFGPVWAAAWVRRDTEDEQPIIEWRRFSGDAPLDGEDTSWPGGALPMDQPELIAMPPSFFFEDLFGMTARFTSDDPFGDLVLLGFTVNDPNAAGGYGLASVAGRDETNGRIAGRDYQSIVFSYTYGTPMRGVVTSLNEDENQRLSSLRSILEDGVEGPVSPLATAEAYWVTWTGTLAGMRDQGFLGYRVAVGSPGERMCADGAPCGGPNAGKLLYDWDARTLVSESEGVVTEWRDRVTGVTFFFPQGQRPMRNLSDRVFDHQPSIEFFGNESGVTSLPVPLPDSATWVFVSEVKPEGSNMQVMLETGEPHFQSPPGGTLVYHDGTRWVGGFSTASGSGGRYAWTAHSPAIVVVPFEPLVMNESIPALYVNGDSTSTRWGGSAPLALDDRTWHLGSRNSEAFFWKGAVARIRVYATALTQEESANETAWLAEQYGLLHPDTNDGIQCADGQPCEGPNADRLLYDWDARSMFVEDGGEITEWTDRVSGRATFIFAEGDRPVRNPTDTGFDGRPSIEFGGGELGQTDTDVTLPDSATWVFVTEQSGSGVRILFEAGNPSFQAAVGSPIVMMDGSTWVAGLATLSSTAVRTFVTSASPTISVLSVDPGATATPFPSWYFNGVNSGTTSGTLPPNVLIDHPWRIGGRPGTTYFWQGSIARIRVYSGTFDATQAAAEDDWLREEYDL